MTTEQIITYSILAIAIITVVGNGLSAGLVAIGRPKAARFVDGFALGSIAAIKRASELPPDKPKDGPTLPPGTGGAIMVGLAIGFAIVALTGCGGALRGAAEVANYAAQAGNEAQSMVHDKCTVPMQSIASEPATPERVLKAKALAANCDKIEDAYDALRRGHMALVSAIVAAQSDRGVTVGELIAITDSVAQSLVTLEKAIRAQSIAAQKFVTSAIVEAVK